MKDQSIVKKIISDAEAKAEQTVAEANRNAEQIIQRAEQSAEEFKSAQLAASKSRGEAALEGRKISARLDASKLVLNAKIEALNKVFTEALELLCSLPEGEYVAFISQILQKHAEGGEKIVLSERCSFAEKIAELSVVKERDLVISGARGSFLGGVVIEGQSCDKNLTFEALIDGARESLQTKMAAQLFD